MNGASTSKYFSQLSVISPKEANSRSGNFGWNDFGVMRKVLGAFYHHVNEHFTAANDQNSTERNMFVVIVLEENLAEFICDVDFARLCVLSFAGGNVQHIAFLSVCQQQICH